MIFKTNYRLIQVKSIAECSIESILQYFRPSLSYHLSLSSFLCLFLSGRFTQVLLYFHSGPYSRPNKQSISGHYRPSSEMPFSDGPKKGPLLYVYWETGLDSKFSMLVECSYTRYIALVRKPPWELNNFVL